MSFKKALLELDILLLLLLICTIYVIFQYLIQEFVLTETVFIESYAGILATDQLQSLLKLKEKWGWIGFLIPFIFIPIKVLFTSSALLVGFVLANKEVEFKQVYRIVLLAEFVSVFAVLVQFVGLNFFEHPQTIEEINYYAPLTLASIVTIQEWPKWIHPLFYAISFYQVIYLLLLTYLFSNKKETFLKWISPIFITYSVWFIFIYTFILYLYLLMNPS